MEGLTTPGNGSGRSRPWRQLPTAVQKQLLSLLPPNDRALSGRLVSPNARDGLSGPEDCTASLSQPLPPHAAPWAVEAGQQHVRQLPFRHKLQLMCTAAASGSEVNLEVALALLQPSIFPELLHDEVRTYDWDVGTLLTANYCPGTAAAKAGHLQLLQWLVRRCPGLMWPGGVLKAAARHCDLAGLQVAWEALQHGFSSSNSRGRHPVLSQDVLDAAAESSTPDALAKVQWVLQTAVTGAGGGGAEGGFCCRLLAVATGAGGGRCRLQLSTAAAAARSGDLGRPQWLRDRGCPMGRGAGQGQAVVLEAALQHACLAVVQWLVDEAGCELPAVVGGDMAAEERRQRDRAWTYLLRAAAERSDAVAKWQWLQERGGPSVAGAEQGLVEELTVAAVEAGQVEAVQHLLSVHGASKVLAVGRYALSRAAALSGSIPVAKCLQQAGLALSHKAYGGAAGNLPFVRWLALEAKMSAAAYACEDLRVLIAGWPRDTPAHSRDLLEAVQLLAGAGFCDWGGNVKGFNIHAAANRGDLDLVRHLQEQGVMLDPDLYLIATAADAGCEALLEFLTTLPDCLKPSADLDSTPYVAAARHGDRATLDALRRLGVPWGGDAIVAEAVHYRCDKSSLHWLVEHGAPLGSAEEMEEKVAHAIKYRRVGPEMAVWLRGLATGGSEGPDGGKRSEGRGP